MVFENFSSKSSTNQIQKDGMKKVVIVGQKLKENFHLSDILKKSFKLVVYSDTGFEHLSNEENVIFVIDNFDGSIYQHLNKFRCCILGPPAALSLNPPINRGSSGKQRPLYNLSMSLCVVCFTGFKIKDHLTRLADLVHRMGGSIRKDMSSKITHLISNSTSGDKYRTAVGMGIIVVSDDWILKSWDKRDEHLFSAIQIQDPYKLSPFSQCILSFSGFPREELNQMEQMALNHGGTVVQVGSPMATHLIINDSSPSSPHLVTSLDPYSKSHMVKSEWFWASIQMEACADETLYLFHNVLFNNNNNNNNYNLNNYNTNNNNNNEEDNKSRTPGSVQKRTPGTPSSNGSAKSKRKRVRENLANLANEPGMPLNKKSSMTTVARSSISSSFLDATADGSFNLLDQFNDNDSFSQSVTNNNKSNHSNNNNKEHSHKITLRQQTINELMQTEVNYVNILNIIKMFKEQIEDQSQPGGVILDQMECREIFGSLLSIQQLHQTIKQQLIALVSNQENNLTKKEEKDKKKEKNEEKESNSEVKNNEILSVGEIFLSHSDEFMRFYPGFINFFEKSRVKLQALQRERPRLQAFLKLCKSNPQSGRQPLEELMIRPVQRLPSVALLLKDILKRTDSSHHDYKSLQQAISNLEDVMKHINEDKRRAEGHQAMFEIVHEIENCPPNLLSAHRTFITKIDVAMANDELVFKGTSLCLFLFSDSIEICKKKNKTNNSYNNSSIHNNTLSHKNSKIQKSFKHVMLLQLSHIKRVVDIWDILIPQIFALVIKLPEEEERLLAFSLDLSSSQHTNNNNSNNNNNNNLRNSFMSSSSLSLSNDISFNRHSSQQDMTKEEVLLLLSKSICVNMCRTDHESLLASVESHELNIEIPEGSKGSLSRTAARISKRVSRVFSLNKTPTGMKRAISSVTQLISPLNKQHSSASISQNNNYNNKNNENTPIQDFFKNSIDSDKFSDIVDRVSMGTPDIQRRRETLAGISLNDSKIPENEREDLFLTPHSIPIKHRLKRIISSSSKTHTNHSHHNNYNLAKKSAVVEYLHD